MLCPTLCQLRFSGVLILLVMVDRCRSACCQTVVALACYHAAMMSHRHAVTSPRFHITLITQQAFGKVQLRPQCSEYPWEYRNAHGSRVRTLNLKTKVNLVVFFYTLAVN
jgi:cytochrome oxidase Cu insertion factor (SCO1/SenC/PrrC family)